MKRMPLVSAAAAALLLAGCGTGAESPEAEGLDPAEPVAVNVAETAGVPSAYLNYGVQQGFFEEEGLDVTVDVSAGGAAAVPGLMSGGLQLAGSNTVSALLAVEKGLPITMVAPGTFGSETEGEDFSAVLVAENSDIREPADLAGSTIAVNTLENIGDVTISAALEEHGVDPAGVEFVEIGFPDMIPALERGQIDAAWEIEPFVNVADEEVLSVIDRVNAAKGTQEYRISEIFLSATPETAAETPPNDSASSHTSRCWSSASPASARWRSAPGAATSASNAPTSVASSGRA